MNLDHVEVSASSFFHRASCPKDGSELIQLSNGWFKVCWYCRKCGYPYELKMMKMSGINQENLNKLLDEWDAQKGKNEKPSREPNP